MSDQNIITLISDFRRSYDSKAKDLIWTGLSQSFHRFWHEQVMSDGGADITENEGDEIIRILDRNGRGNTRESEAIAKAMVAQGAWQRMFNEFHANREFGALITSVLDEVDPERRAAHIDKLYEHNKNNRNFVTGPSGNVICTFLAAYDPHKNLSVISLKDRRAILTFLGVDQKIDWENSSIGKKIVESNQILLETFHQMDLNESAMTVSRFCYFPAMQELWKDRHTVKRPDRKVNVIVPTVTDETEDGEANQEDIRESMRMQAMLAEIGTCMGFTIWLPKSDRGRVLKVWKPEPGELIDELPLGYDTTTIKTIEQIDVIWLKRRSIVRAFEVEHTTSVYSGLLRMADLVALQPNINIRLHIVAPASKRDKVMQEIQRPVFSLLEGRALSEMCSYLSYDSIVEIRNIRHLEHLSDKFIEEYEERADLED